MAFIPRMPEITRVAEVLEHDHPGPEAAAREALSMAFGVIFMRQLWVTLNLAGSAVMGPYATEKDARKETFGNGGAGPLWGLGGPLQARHGGPWVGWCECGHRNNDHEVSGPRKMRCLHGDCECKQAKKITDKQKGAGWVPHHTWPTNYWAQHITPVLEGEYETPEAMARDVLKKAWVIVREHKGHMIWDGTQSFGPYLGETEARTAINSGEAPYTSGAWQTLPLI